MNYEQRYKEALERARKIENREPINVPDGTSIPVVIFPELKESEDERIRKAIHIYLDWLDGRKDYAPKGEYSIRDMIAWLEKQGKQKTVDKVEPRFHEGDWVVSHYNHVAHIKAIDEKNYFLSCDNGSCERLSIEYIDRNWRLWTIKDAKDGDMLHSPSHRLIWIYKNCGQYYACVNMNYTTENICTNGSMVIPNDVCPATKDEQTILFERIKEEGYEWSDKKELIKL